MSRNTVFSLAEINNTCAAALAAQGLTMDSPNDRVAEALGTVFSESGKRRAGGKGCLYQSISAKVPGKSGGITVRIKGERLSGQIAPNNVADLALVNSRLKAGRMPLTLRDRHPSYQIQKWSRQVPTEDDDITIKTDPETGKLMTPSDEFLSPFFQYQAYLSKWFITMMRARKERGAILEFSEKYKIAENKAPADACCVPSTKVVDPIQWAKSNSAAANSGRDLPNPMARISMKFDDKTGEPVKTQYFDASSRYPDPDTGKPRFEGLQFTKDGLAVSSSDTAGYVTANNVHNLASGSVNDGLVNQDAIVYSNMGISIPSSMLILIYSAPQRHTASLDDMFDSDDDESSAMPPPAPREKKEEEEEDVKEERVALPAASVDAALEALGI